MNINEKIMIKITMETAVKKTETSNPNKRIASLKIL
jgi:hypothetical protein